MSELVLAKRTKFDYGHTECDRCASLNGILVIIIEKDGTSYPAFICSKCLYALRNSSSEDAMSNVVCAHGSCTEKATEILSFANKGKALCQRHAAENKRFYDQFVKWGVSINDDQE